MMNHVIGTHVTQALYGIEDKYETMASNSSRTLFPSFTATALCLARLSMMIGRSTSLVGVSVASFLQTLPLMAFSSRP